MQPHLPHHWACQGALVSLRSLVLRRRCWREIHLSYGLFVTLVITARYRFSLRLLTTASIMYIHKSEPPAESRQIYFQTLEEKRLRPAGKESLKNSEDIGYSRILLQWYLVIKIASVSSEVTILNRRSIHRMTYGKTCY